MSVIEQRVKALNELRAKADRLDGFMRRMRLGAKPGLEIRPVWWRRMVYGFGYLEQEVEPMPEGMEREFYAFLADRHDEAARDVRRAEALLASVADPAADVPKEAGR